MPWYKSSQSKLSSPGQLLCKLYCISKRKPLKLKSLINISLANFSIRSCVQSEKPDCVKWDTSRYLRLASSDRLKLAWKGIEQSTSIFIISCSCFPGILRTNLMNNSLLTCYNCSSIVTEHCNSITVFRVQLPANLNFFRLSFRTYIARLTVIIFSNWVFRKRNEVVSLPGWR